MMDVRKFQEICSEIVSNLDDKYDISRDAQFNISQLLEELGELSKEVNRKKLRGEEPKKEDLEEEFADVILQIMKLADLCGVDIEKSVLEKIEVLRERHNL